MDTPTLKVNVTTEYPAPCSALLKIEVPADEAQVVYSKTAKEVASRASLPGFRPGKVPMAILQRNFGPQIEARTTEKLFDEGYKAAVDAAQLSGKIIGSPELAEESQNVKYETGKPFAYAVTFDVRPDIQVPEYKGLQLSREKREVTDEVIQLRIDSFLDMSAKMEVTEGPAKRDDIITAAYEATLPEGLEIPETDKYIVKTDKAWLALREPEQLPGISTALLDVTPKCERDVDIAFPADFKVEALQGKTLKYHFVIDEIRSRIRPELNDEFVKQFGAESVEKFREIIKNRLAMEFEQGAKYKMIEQIDNLLFSNLSFDLPPRQLKQVCGDIYRNMVEREKRSGTSDDDIKAKDADIKKDAKASAENSLRRSYVMEKIIEAEKVAVSEDDYKNVLAYFLQMAPRGSKPEQVFKEKRENGEFMRALQEIITQRTYDKIIEQAQVVDVPAEA
ncbi:MAG: trigger factor [Victivallales bacterium]|nr:trigger factor [Victivallales bacterium]